MVAEFRQKLIQPRLESPYRLSQGSSDRQFSDQRFLSTAIAASRTDNLFTC